ncbi:MAG: hypothetical protein ACO3EZ_17675 [Prochlorotrichaceae cyanobacterium]
MTMKFLGTIELSPGKVTLSRSQIIRDWETGILNDTAYVYLILQYQYQNNWKDRLNKDGIGNAIVLDEADIEYLRMDWKGTGEGKKLFLQHKAIVQALQKIAEAAVTRLEFQQLTIPDCDRLLGLEPPPPLIES